MGVLSGVGMHPYCRRGTFRQASRCGFNQPRVNCRIKTHKHPLELREKAFEMFSKDNTFAQISAVLNVSEGTIAGWSSRGRWKERRKTVLAAKPGIQAVSSPSQSDTLDSSGIEMRIAEGLTFREKQERFRDRAAVQAMRVPAIIASLPDLVLVQQADKVARLLQEARKALNLEDSAPRIVVNLGLLAQPPQLKQLEAREVVSELSASTDANEGEATGCAPVSLS